MTEAVAACTLTGTAFMACMTGPGAGLAGSACITCLCYVLYEFDIISDPECHDLVCVKCAAELVAPIKACRLESNLVTCVITKLGNAKDCFPCICPVLKTMNIVSEEECAA